MSRTFILAALTAACGIAACGKLLAPAAKKETVWIRQRALQLDVGSSVAVTAGTGGPGEPADTAVAAGWTSGNPAVLRIEQDGALTALAPGASVVTARFGGGEDTARVRVLAPSHAWSGTWKWISVGWETTCGVYEDSHIYCWGGGHFGALGVGWLRMWSYAYSPLRVQGDVVFEKVDVGLSHACALATTGHVYCWGDFGAVKRQLSPLDVSNGLRFRDVVVGSQHACGLTQEGRAYCWGVGLAGELGDGISGFHVVHEPTRVLGDHRYTLLRAGDGSTCGLRVDGHVDCWGSGSSTGNGGTDVAVPTRVSLPDSSTYLTGRGHYCAGAGPAAPVYCWGPNRFGQLGFQDEWVLEPRPDTVAGRFTRVVAGNENTCGFTSDDHVFCWGSDYRGNLGSSEPAPETCGPFDDVPCSRRPLPVADLQFTQLSMHQLASCGITTTGALFCWGSNQWGQLGRGTTLPQASVPARVADPME